MRPARAMMAAAAAACALAVAGCGDTLQLSPISHNNLENLLVARFPVYWLGDRFQGLEVTETAHDPSDAYSVSYGACLKGGEGYCVPPLRVVTSPDNSFLPGGGTRSTTRPIRRSLALLDEAGRTIVLPTGTVVIDIYADSATLARAAARAAAPINAVGFPTAPLPARLPSDRFEQRPLPTQVPNPLHPLGSPPLTAVGVSP